MKPASPDRRKLVLGGAALLAGAIPPGSAVAENAASLTNESTMPPTPDYAVFTEFSPDNKPMKGGWNRRVFTDTDVRKGTAIQCDFATGIVTLAPGAYHITGLSMVAYNSGGEPPEMTTIRAPRFRGVLQAPYRRSGCRRGVDGPSCARQR